MLARFEFKPAMCPDASRAKPPDSVDQDVPKAGSLKLSLNGKAAGWAAQIWWPVMTLVTDTKIGLVTAGADAGGP